MTAADNDLIAIAQEFRSANDEDVLQILKVQSTKKDWNRLFYYVVPAEWMRQAWPVLSGLYPSKGSVEAPIGRIQLHNLIVRDHEVSDEEEVEKMQTTRDLFSGTTTQPSREDSSERLDAQSHRTGVIAVVGDDQYRPWKKSSLRPNLQHRKDYVLLGPSAWQMVKRRFGCDMEIRRKLTVAGTSDRTTLSVVMEDADLAKGTPALLVEIPPTGRFPYESFFMHQKVANHELPHPGNVSDDDDTDLFPMIDDGEADESPIGEQHQSTKQYNPDNGPIFLLPPSTTNTGSSHVYEEECERECGTNGEVVITRSDIRRYGSGLGNLGNTCFMNSTLQCLAHTDPLRKYFLSGDYLKDLNADNPLGTGGDLAMQFAELLAEIWQTGKRKGASYSPYLNSHSNDPNSTSNVVYPRNFKYTVGKHAEQFMGYDQHDSQEFATYLLDALHEDTNRVTKKPYVEKPEQAEEESDEDAAQKAWELHKKREDSYIMENFMAQMKSRVQCCEAQCGRVSTTFDPIMFLSVPIPGSLDRYVQIKFVPLNPKEKVKSFNIVISKIALMSDLLKKVQERIDKSNLTGLGHSVAIEDMIACDVWQKEIHSWHGMTREVSVIRDNDETIVYELSPLERIQHIEGQVCKNEPREESIVSLRNFQAKPRRYQLDVAELTRLNQGDAWVRELKHYIASDYSYSYAFEPPHGNTDERVKYYKKLLSFIDLCYREVEEEEGSAELDVQRKITVSPSDEGIRGIIDRCDTQKVFANVKSVYDITVLDFISKKMRAEIIRLEEDQVQSFPNGIILEIRLRKQGSLMSLREQRLAPPLVLRVPSSTTVFELREELALRLSRCIISPQMSIAASTSHDMLNGDTDKTFGSSELLVLRQIPMLFQRKGGFGRVHTAGPSELGSVRKQDSYTMDGVKTVSLASPADDEERARIGDVVGDLGVIYLDWPPELVERHLDVQESSIVEDIDAKEDIPVAKNGIKETTVQDCIDKFCQMEQLEESEMWYCNRCQKHVQAWKQNHIYRSPPILLIHLKRFQYSARSHRRDKISTFVEFPLKNLDLTSHVLSWNPNEKPIYDCYAVSNHYGGLGGGHYTAYALNDDGGWCYYDDSRITTDVDPQEVVSEAAYVLYYRRQDVPVGQEFPLHLQTPYVSAPTLIKVERAPDTEASEVSSFAAMAGEDMDIDEVDDAASQVTSLMGSEPGDDDPLEGDNDMVTDNHDNNSLPLQ